MPKRHILQMILDNLFECSAGNDLPKLGDLIVHGDLGDIMAQVLQHTTEENRKELSEATNDPRYYPRKPPHFGHPRVLYVNELTLLSTIGRAAKPNFDSKGLNPRVAPSSFNFRSLTRSFNSVPEAIKALRIRAAVGKSGFCSPAVSHDGTITDGESRLSPSAYQGTGAGIGSTERSLERGPTSSQPDQLPSLLPQRATEACLNG